MREKREDRSSGKSLRGPKSSDRRSSGSGSRDEKKSYSSRSDSARGERKSFGDRDEKRSYSSRSESGSSERRSFGDRDEKRSYSRKSDDSRSSRFSDRDEKKTYSSRSSDGSKSSYFDRKEEKSRSGFGGERKSRSYDDGEKRSYSSRGSDRDEKRSYSSRSESGSGERKSRFGDRDEKRSYSSRSESGSSERRSFGDRDEKRSYSSRGESARGERKSFGDRDEKRSYSRKSDDSRSSRFGDRDEKRSYSRKRDEFETDIEFKPTGRKPRVKSEDIIEVDYTENSSSKLIDKNSFEDETRNTYIYGRHPVVEAINGETPVNKVWIAEGTRDTDEIVEHVKDKNIPYKIVTKTKLSYMVGENANHQGVVAEVAGKEYTELHDLIELTKQKEVFFIILDKVEDPHNLGAIIRTADAAGVDAIIIPKHRAVGLTGIVTKSSAGAIDRMKICRVANLTQTMEELKKANVWIVGIDMEGADVYSNANLKGAIALTVGGEGEGLTRLVKENCDFIVKIPMSSQSNSLNVSVATAIVTYEIYKQKEFKI